MGKSVFSKMMGVGRATVFTVGLVMILAVVLGVATAALGAPKTIVLERACCYCHLCTKTLDLHPKDREQGGRLRPLEHCENIGALAESGQSREEGAMRKIGRRGLLMKRRDA